MSYPARAEGLVNMYMCLYLWICKRVYIFIYVYIFLFFCGVHTPQKKIELSIFIFLTGWVIKCERSSLPYYYRSYIFPKIIRVILNAVNVVHDFSPQHTFGGAGGLLLTMPLWPLASVHLGFCLLAGKC